MAAYALATVGTSPYIIVDKTLPEINKILELSRYWDIAFENTTQPSPQVFWHCSLLTLGRAILTRTGLPKYKTCIEVAHLQKHT